MTKKKKLIIKVCIGIAIFIVALCIFDRITTYRVYYGPNSIVEKDGIIEMKISIASSVGYVHHYDLVEIDKGIYEIQIYGSITNGDFSGDKIYKIDNRDGHIKEMRDGEGKTIYKNEGKKQ